MATPVLNNGILLRDTTYNASSHVDSYHMMNMLGDLEPMDLGPVDMWAMAQKVEMPLYQMSSFGGKNTILVDNIRGEYKWNTPISQDLPYIIEDIESSNTTKGADGNPFRVKLNRQAFGHGDIFTYNKFNGEELYVTSDPILPIGDGFIYTVRLVNNGNTTYLDNKYLANGTKVFRVGSARGEYGHKFADMTVRGGSREFYNFVGGANAHASFSISNKADLMARGGMTATGVAKLTEVWKIKDNPDPSIPTIDALAKKMGPAWTRKAYESGQLSRSFVTTLEAAHIAKIGVDIETYLMWGKGGRLTQDGADDIRMSTGLWKQLDNSYKRVYNKSSFSLDIFRTELYNFYAGRVEFTGPDAEREIEVQTGMGGMRMVSQLISKEANSAGMVIQAADNNGVGAISGKGMELGFGFAYNKYKIFGLANLTFKVNPAFDNMNTNDIENPLIDGYPLSSYSFIIFDVTDNTNDNIFLLKKKWDNNLRWWYENYTMDYLGKTQGFQSSGSGKSGYAVFMEQAYPTIWVADPTKLLKVVMRNPITQGSL